jgi:nucleolar protein 16
MVRPSKRRKVKNPSQKTSRKAKNPYNISFAGVHPLVKSNWDKKLTLRQNYERMGLVSALNGKAGGEAIMVRPAKNDGEGDDGDDGLGDLPISYVSYEEFEKMPAVSAGAGSSKNKKNKTQRKSGNSNAEEGEEDEEMEEDDEQEDDDVEDEEEDGIEGDIQFDPRATHIGVKLGLRLSNPTAEPPRFPSVSTKRSIKPLPVNVAELMQELCKGGDIPVFRHVSEHEAKVLVDLVRKHGEDYGAMAQDIKLNTFQLTAGQLKKKVNKMLQSQTSN